MHLDFIFITLFHQTTYCFLWYKLGDETLGARSRGIKDVTCKQQTTDQKDIEMNDMNSQRIL